ncbi:hypothetical protein BG011_005672, partial [Mortierella polycephala]
MTRRHRSNLSQSQSPSPFSFGHTQTTARVTPAAVTTTSGNHSAFAAGTGFNIAGTDPFRDTVFSVGTTTSARGMHDISEAPAASLFSPIPANVFTRFPPSQTTGPATTAASTITGTATGVGASTNIYNSRDILKRTALIMEYNKSIQFRLKWYANILTKEKSVSQAFRTSNDEYDFDCRITTFDDHRPSKRRAAQEVGVGHNSDHPEPRSRVPDRHADNALSQGIDAEHL